jgi:hypothetical protein
VSVLDVGTLLGTLDLDIGPFQDGLDSADGSLGAAGEKLGGTAKLIGAGIGAALAFSLASAMNVEEANSKLQAQLGLTKEQSAAMGKTAGELFASNYGDSIGSVNDALASVVRNIDGMSTASADELKGVTAKVLDLSSAFGVDLAESTRAVGVLMKTGLAKDATEALDLVTKGLQSPVNAAGDLLDTFDEYSTVFRTLGLDGKDALGLLQQGLKGGARDADQIADSMKELLLRVQAGDANGGLRAIGLDATAMQTALQAGGEGAKEATEKIISGFNGIASPSEKAQIGLALFGTKAEDAQKALGALDLTTAASDFEALNGPVDGAAASMDSALGSSRQAQIDTFIRGVQGMATNIGQALLPVVDVLLSSLGGLGTILSGAVEAFQAMPVPMQIVAGVAVAVGLAFTGVGTAIKAAFLSNPVGIAIVGITVALGAMVSAFSNAKGPVADLTGVVDAQTGALDKNSKATLANSLEKDGTLAKMRALGVAQGDYTAAVLGDIGAQERVGAILSANAKKAFDAGAGIDVNTGAVVNNSAAYAEAQGLYDSFKNSAQGVQDQVAAGKAVLAESGTGVSDLGGKAADAAAEMKALGGGAAATVTNMGELTAATAAATPPLTVMQSAFKTVSDTASAADDSVKFFNITVNAMMGINVSAQESTKLLNDAVRTTAGAFKDAKDATKNHVASLLDANGAINTTTEAGSKLYDGLQDMKQGYDVAATAAHANAVANGNTAGALAEAQFAAENARAKFLDMAKGMNLSDVQAGLLADSLGIVEGKKLTDKNFAVNAQGIDPATQAVNALDKKQISNKSFTITAITDIAGQAANLFKGGLFGAPRAAGGPILGPGPKGVDSVLTPTAPGEWVLNDQQVDAMGGFAGVAAMLANLGKQPAGYVPVGVGPQSSPIAVQGGGNTYQAFVYPRTGEVVPADVLRAMRELERTSA